MLRLTAPALCALSFALVAHARADERVVVFDRGDRPGFLAALRIELGLTTEVMTEPEHPAELGQLDRIERSTRVLEEGSARLALWLEIEGDEAVLTMVGPRHGRAVVDVVRVPAEDSPDFDRSLALKVSDVLDSLRAAASTGVSHALEEPTARPLPTPQPRPPAEPASSVALALEASGRIAVSNGTAPFAAGGAFDLALRFAIGPLSIEPTGGMVLFGTVELASGAQGQVEALELGPSAGVRLFYEAPPLGVGGGLFFGTRILVADGRTSGGSEGSETAVIPSLSALVMARIALFGGLYTRLAAGIEVGLVRQRFLLNDVAVADAGTIRFVADLGLGISTR